MCLVYEADIDLSDSTYRPVLKQTIEDGFVTIELSNSGSYGALLRDKFGNKAGWVVFSDIELAMIKGLDACGHVVRCAGKWTTSQKLGASVLWEGIAGWRAVFCPSEKEAPISQPKSCLRKEK